MANHLGSIMTYWKAICKNGQTVTENSCKWDQVKDNIISLALVDNDQTIELPRNMDSYVQGKTASVTLGSSNGINLESRYIGFVQGNSIVRIRLAEKTGNITVEYEPKYT